MVNEFVKVNGLLRLTSRKSYRLVKVNAAVAFLNYLVPEKVLDELANLCDSHPAQRKGDDSCKHH